MTVCTASIMNWVYGPDDVGQAVVIASDRMYSDRGLGIEYESSRTKVAYLGLSRLLLVAGDLTFNSLAISTLMTWIYQNEVISTYQVAEMYGRIVATLSFERAAKAVLNPLGIFANEIITDDSGLKRYGLPDALVVALADQLQASKVASETIIVGCDNKLAQIFRVDEKGVVSLHSDIGFVSIGNGGIHSTAYFMQMPYSHTVSFSGGFISTFFAKKRAEIAPGVGSTTDMAIVNGSGIINVPPDDIAVLEQTYRAERKRVARLQRSLEAKFTQKMQKKHATSEPTNLVEPRLEDER